MKICVVGCGAIGSVFAAHLAKAGNEVFVYDASPECVGAINEHGLHVSGTADITVEIAATTKPADIPLCDFGIFATKSIHTAAAIAQTSHIFGQSGAVCSIQNGLGNEELIAERVPKVIRGVTNMAAHIVSPGHSELEFYGHFWIGPFEPTGTPYALAQEFATVIAEAGLPCVPLEDARGAQWTKVIFNCAVNAVGALTHLHHGAAVRYLPSAGLLESILREGEAVAKALDITLDDNPRVMLAEGARAPGKRNPSMLMDIWAGRPTEIDFLNGAIADLGETLDVPVPVNRALWQLIRGLEHSWTDPA